MTEHIPAGELEKLGSYEVYGRELLKCLEHLEACAECRAKMPKPSVEQITRRLLADEPENEVSKIEVDAQAQQEQFGG